MWEREGDHYYDKAEDIKPADVKPWRRRCTSVDQLISKRTAWTPSACPLGPAAVTTSDAVKFIQMPSLIVILFEDLTYRQIHMDGRKLPKDPNPSWMGYSV